MALSSIQLEAFFCLAQAGQFTRASQRLHITQSALSQRIFNLEAELGQTLFLREKAGVRLTEVGLELLRYCQAKESLESEYLERTKTESPSELAGAIRVAGFSTVMDSLIIPALAPLALENPKVRLNLQTREIEELPGMLKKGEVDFIILDQKLERSRLISHFIGEEENVLVEKKNYRGPKVFLDHDENDLTTYNYFKLRNEKIDGARHYLDNIHGLLAGLSLGLGRAVIPKHLISNHKNFKILHSNTVLRVPIVLHYYEQAYYSKLHNRVVQSLLRGL